jgi:hypothetical protein
MSKSYLDRMRKLRSESKSYAATVIDAKPQEKSLKTKNKRRNLTTVVKRSRIAAKKNPKTRSMMRARKAKRRARDARGHFIKKKRTAARNPVKRKRAKRAGSKRVAKRRGVTRIKRALGRKRSNGRFTRRGKHRVRGYRRKVAGRSKKTLVRAHSSYEAAPKKRKRRRSAAKEEVMKENPRRRRRRRSGKARRRHNPVMENPRKRKHKRRSPRRRARRRSTTTAVMPAVVRRRTRKGGRRTSPAAVKVVVIRGLSGGRRKKRRSSSKRRRGAHKRKHAHKRRSHRRGYTPASHQLVAASEAGFFENPLGGYALENPLSGGELALAAGTAAVGYILTDFLDRYLANAQYAPATLPAGATAFSTAAGGQISNTVPGMTRIFAQAGIAAAAFAGAHFVEKPMGRAALQGAGLGALTHLLGQLFNHYVMANFVVSSSAPTTWQALYAAEIQSDTAATNSNLNTLGGFLGLGAPPARPRVLQRPNASIPYREVGPRAVAAPPASTGVGNCVPCMSGDQTAASAAAALQDTGGGTSFVPQGPPPVDQSGWNGSPPSGGNGSNGGAACPGSNGTTPAPVASGSNGSGQPTNLGGLKQSDMFPDE